METHTGEMARRSKSKSEMNKNMSNEILLSEQFNHLIFALPPDGIDVYRIGDDNDSSVEDTYDTYISTPSLYRSFFQQHMTKIPSTTRSQGIINPSAYSMISPHRSKGRYTMDATEFSRLNQFNTLFQRQARGLIHELTTEVIRYDAAFLVGVDKRRIRIRSSKLRRSNETRSSSMIIY